MPRFDHLELGPSRDRPEDDRKGVPDPGVDEQHWLGMADAERRRGLHENALRYYSRSLEDNRSLIAGWLGQVQMLVALGEYPEAEMWARKALELFRNNGDLLAARAQALCRLKDRTGALAGSDAAMGQAGESAYRWQVRGEVMVLVRSDIDRHCFDKALHLSPDWLVATEIARAYLFHDQPGKAITRARQGVERGPDQVYAWYVQALCERELNLVEAARRSARRCLELVPGHRDADLLLAQMDNEGWSLGRAVRRLFRRD
jgi:tetratricopeptide (TPR) repeat protein